MKYLFVILFCCGSVFGQNITNLYVGQQLYAGMQLTTVPSAAAGPSYITNGLIAWWKLDDASGTTASDSSGNGNAGTNTSALFPKWTNGVAAGGLYFGGANYIRIPDNSGLMFGTNDFSISFWAKGVPLTGVGGTVLAKSGYGVGANDWAFYVLSGNLVFRVNYINLFNQPFPTSETNSWTHLVFERNNGVDKGFFNTVATSTNADTGNYNATTTLSIGFPTGAGSSGYLTGTLDDIRIYNRALSATEVTNIFNGQ